MTPCQGLVQLIKKEYKYKQRNEVRRQQFIHLISAVSAENLVYVDETGIANNLTVQYGWSPSGQRSYSEKLGFSSDRRSVVAAYNYGTKNIIAPFEYEGHMTKDLFIAWFKNVLCPSLTAGQLVILDNATFHKDDELFEIIKEYDCKLLYLPPYSPDLNPIEHFWANFKRNLRKVIKKFDSLTTAITYAMTIILSD